MTRTITLSEADHKWLKQECIYQLNRARTADRYAMPSYIEQLNANIASLEAIVGALADAE